ncbi:MAG: hypothetical protein J7J20_04235 [Desulfurococcales archaeon]|nr:hypothetical protein [Desulfurococcales archaeon]
MATTKSVINYAKEALLDELYAAAICSRLADHYEDRISPESSGSLLKWRRTMHGSGQSSWGGGRSVLKGEGE